MLGPLLGVRTVQNQGKSSLDMAKTEKNFLIARAYLAVFVNISHC